MNDSSAVNTAMSWLNHALQFVSRVKPRSNVAAVMLTILLPSLAWTQTARSEDSRQPNVVLIMAEESQPAPVAEPPLEEGFVPLRFQLPPGYQAELVAGPPLVRHPMMACFDDRGRLFIAESAGQNLRADDLEQQLPNFIRMLEDRDGDGRFDRSTIFADGMTLPQGALWHQGALYVASPPNIWRLVDTNDDGVADQRTVLVNRFGYTGNAASIHGCFLGPDGRIYWCDGRHGHEFRDENGNVVSQRAGSYIFSVNPDGTDVRIHCGGGMDNPVEVDFLETGEMLGTVNILYSRPRQDCLVHWLYGGAYPHSERVLGELKRTGDLLGPVHDFGHVAVSGMTRYRSGTLDREFQDQFFVTQFNTGRVQRVMLERDGATFRAEAHEFLQCESRDFHPTDVLEDADGSLLVVDTGGWFLLGCPTSQIARPQIAGGIYRITRTGMTPPVDPRGTRIAWPDLTAGELTTLSNDTRHEVRERAVQEFARRGDEVVPTLIQSIRQRDSRERRQAVWALGRIGSRPALQAVIPALTDPAVEVKLAAAHVLAQRPTAEALPVLIEALADRNAAVRAAAARALGRLGLPEAVPPLLKALSTAVDRSENHALIFALIEIDRPQETRTGLAASQGRIQAGALIALEQMNSSRLTGDEVARLSASLDPVVSQAALEILERHREWDPEAIGQLLVRLRSPDSWSQRELVARMTARYLADSRVQTLVAETLLNPAARQQSRETLIDALLQSSGVTPGPELVAAITAGLSSSDLPTLEQAIAIADRLRSPELDATLKAVGTNERFPALVRISSLRAMSTQRGPLDADLFGMLLQQLAPEATVRERISAAQMLGSSPLSQQQLVALSEKLETAGPVELRELIRPYQRSSHPEVADAFLTAIAEARSFGSLPTYEFSDVIKRYPESLLPRANQLLDRLRQQDAQRAAHLEQLIRQLPTGDAPRGRSVFASEKAKCSACHRIGQEGGKVGPDLSRIGQIRSRRDLLEAIVYPSSSIVRDYESFTLVTRQGRTLNGLVLKETPEAITIQQQTGDPVVISRAEIDELTPSPVSVMPQGFHELLSAQQLADILAYLQSLQ